MYNITILKSLQEVQAFFQKHPKNLIVGVNLDVDEGYRFPRKDGKLSALFIAKTDGYGGDAVPNTGLVLDMSVKVPNGASEPKRPPVKVSLKPQQ